MCILEARILKSATADAEHVLLAILKDGDNLAATVLEENRVNYQAVFEQLTMQSTNPNAGMGFPEEEEEDDEDMNMSHPSRNAGQARLLLHRLHRRSLPMILRSWITSVRT